MTRDFETLEPVLRFSCGKTIGDEPMFLFPEVMDALASCTQHEISVLGVELMKTSPQGYLTDGISSYDVRLEGRSWQDFVLLNNSLAAQFIGEKHGGDNHFYLLTATLEGEFHRLRSR